MFPTRRGHADFTTLAFADFLEALCRVAALTSEQVVSRRRKLCMDMNQSMQLELVHEVNTPRWQQLKTLVDTPHAVSFDLPGYAKGVLRDMLGLPELREGQHEEARRRLDEALDECVASRAEVGAALGRGAALQF